MKYSTIKILSGFILLLLLSFGFDLEGQASDKFEALDIFNLEYVSDPQISPDGSHIIYVRNFKDIMSDQNLSNLWIIDFDGSNKRPLTTGNHSDFEPRWSNDGKKIIYKSSRNENVQLYLRWLDSGMETKLTNVANPMGNVTWSHNDQFIAFTMFVPEAAKSPIQLPQKPDGAKWNDPPKYIDKLNYRFDGQGYLKNGHFQLFTLSVEGGTPRQLTENPYNHGTPQWFQDDAFLIFSANLREDGEFDPVNSEIYTIHLANKQITASYLAGIKVLFQLVTVN